MIFIQSQRFSNVLMPQSLKYKDPLERDWYISKICSIIILYIKSHWDFNWSIIICGSSQKWKIFLFHALSFLIHCRRSWKLEIFLLYFVLFSPVFFSPAWNPVSSVTHGKAWQCFYMEWVLSDGFTRWRRWWPAAIVHWIHIRASSNVPKQQKRVALNSSCTRKTGRHLIRLGFETKMFCRSLYSRAEGAS